jgi:hypothetical protein
MGFWNPRAICPSCGAKIHTQGRLLVLGASTGKLCPNCGVKLSGRINELTNKAILAPEAKAAQKAERKQEQLQREQLQEKRERTRARQERLAKPWAPGSRDRMWSCPSCATRSSKLVDRCPECGAANPNKVSPVEVAPAKQAMKVESPQSDAAKSSGLISQLESLSKLREQGVLSEEEFSVAKARVLSESEGGSAIN